MATLDDEVVVLKVRKNERVWIGLLLCTFPPLQTTDCHLKF